MIIRKPPGLRYSDATPKEFYLNRRRFLATALAGPALALGGAKLSGVSRSSLSIDEKATPCQIVTQYNNFYEFGTRKDDPAANAKNFRSSPWTLTIDGEVAGPKTLDLDAIMKLAPLEQRICRHRCVEAWSIVVPWIGFSLSSLLKQVEPTSRAKYVAFQSYHDLKQMPLATSFRAGISFPYVEGLRLDEAMHPLTMLAVGIYDEVLPNQNGAPFRLVVPWKYGFKSLKSIVKIRFVEKQPPTTWNLEWSQAYGFYSNVNPERDHPGHSQKKEIRLGEGSLGQRRDTLMFNGYGDQVASLYTGMDLRKYY
jgi:sulfoxide reductase catalytic subunit YedY